ncbi:MAG: hypothetical protein KC423_11995 [Anaerolineales bacterium]|nr:hypothetical protein [Anaerolineales bacterium]
MIADGWMPSASSDWRFLAGMPSGGRALLISLPHPDAAVGLLATYEQVVVVTDSAAKTAVLPPRWRENGRLHWLVTDTLTALSLTELDLVALPHGFWHAPTADLSLARQWLRPNGIIYVGFNGRWHYRRQRQTGASWTPAHIARLLRQHHFTPIEMVGMMPNLAQPATFVPLTATIAGSWVAQKVRPAWVRRLLQHDPWQRLLPHLLPAYGIVARKDLA